MIRLPVAMFTQAACPPSPFSLQSSQTNTVD